MPGNVPLSIDEVLDTPFTFDVAHLKRGLRRLNRTDRAIAQADARITGTDVPFLLCHMRREARTLLVKYLCTGIADVFTLRHALSSMHALASPEDMERHVANRLSSLCYATDAAEDLRTVVFHEAARAFLHRLRAGEADRYRELVCPVALRRLAADPDASIREQTGALLLEEDIVRRLRVWYATTEECGEPLTGELS